MCGIYATVELVTGAGHDEILTAGTAENARDGPPPPPPPPSPPNLLSDALRRRLAGRGPDHAGEAAAAYAPAHGRHGCVLRFASTVLALRGDGLTPQPFVEEAEEGAPAAAADASSSPRAVLCWNGEAWRLGGDDAVVVAGNDGAQLFGRLTEASRRNASAAADDDANGDAVLAVLRAVEGPCAFVYYDGRTGRLYYGRDRLGRRSLLRQRRRREGEDGEDGEDGNDDANRLVLASVGDLSGSGGDDSPLVVRPWAEVEADGIYVVDLAHDAPFSSRGTTRHAWAVVAADDDDDDGAVQIADLGRFNMASEPPVGIGPLAADAPSVRELRSRLAASLRIRVQDVPRPPPPPASGGSSGGSGGSGGGDAPDTRVAVLFSGGLDCTVLARMAHDVLRADQGVDLINVAFENPRVAAAAAAAAAAAGDVFEACPDRITGRASYAELQRVCPGRAWRFLAVNVPYAETLAHRPEIVALMHPHHTEMDLSIASALYFAARGTGVAEAAEASSSSEEGGPRPCTTGTPPTTTATTPARVLLSGLGADELFGGYGRHGVAFARRGYAGLAEELRRDVARLGQRNLGRDDRVLSHWGREVRFPFLDEALVRWAIALPAWAKCDFACPDGSGHEQDEQDRGIEPAKRVLRLVAQSLGMPGVAREKKRAIQFGARTAKMESGRVKGTASIA